MIYLDAAATTRVRPEVLQAIWPVLSGTFGNPASHHEVGESARAVLEDARRRVAAVLGCRPAEVLFTSGGTEADNAALKGIALARRARDPRLDRVLISAIEHPAVTESAEYLARVHGFTVDVAPVDHQGVVLAEEFAVHLLEEAHRRGIRVLPRAQRCGDQRDCHGQGRMEYRLFRACRELS